MKRRELINKFEAKGWRFLRSGHKHDIYTDGQNLEQIPRHSDVNEKLARSMIRRWGL